MKKGVLIFFLGELDCWLLFEPFIEEIKGHDDYCSIFKYYREED